MVVIAERKRKKADVYSPFAPLVNASTGKPLYTISCRDSLILALAQHLLCIILLAEQAEVPYLFRSRRVVSGGGHVRSRVSCLDGECPGVLLCR